MLIVCRQKQFEEGTTIKPYLGRSKWNKWKIINKHSILINHQPLTTLYSPQKLKSLLNLFTALFVKPDDLSHGKLVMRISKTDQNRIHVQLKNSEKHFKDLESFNMWLKKVGGGRRFIIQKELVLFPLQHRKVDMRSIIQKNEKNRWEVTGMFAKVADRGKVLTNASAGGKIISIPFYLEESGMSKREQIDFLDMLRELSIQIGKQISKYYRNHILGLDLGMDHDKKIWLIEINTMPESWPLKKIDKRMYRRILELKRFNKKYDHHA